MTDPAPVFDDVGRAIEALPEELRAPLRFWRRFNRDATTKDLAEFLDAIYSPPPEDE